MKTFKCCKKCQPPEGGIPTVGEFYQLIGGKLHRVSACTRCGDYQLREVKL